MVLSLVEQKKIELYSSQVYSLYVTLYLALGIEKSRWRCVQLGDQTASIEVLMSGQFYE